MTGEPSERPSGGHAAGASSQPVEGVVIGRTWRIFWRVAEMVFHCSWIGALIGAVHTVLFGAIVGDGWDNASDVLALIAVGGMAGGVVGATTGIVMSGAVVPLVWKKATNVVNARLVIGGAVGSAVGLGVAATGRAQVLGTTQEELLALASLWLMPVVGFLLAGVWIAVRTPNTWTGHPASCCQSCGYDRRGIDADAVCPECGAGS